MAHHQAHASTTYRLRFSWRYAFILACLAIMLYVVIPQVGSFRHSLTLLGTAQLGLIIVAFIVVVGTYFLAAAVCWLLAIKPVSYSRMTIVQGASGFTNRLLPAGLGGMGIKAAFLRRSRHSIPQATGVVVVNNALGLAGHFLLLGIVLAISPAGSIHINGPSRVWLVRGVIAVVVVGLALAVIYMGKLARGLRRWIASLLGSFAAYGSRLPAVSLALMCSVLLTAGNVVVFYMCAQGMGASMSLSDTFVAFTVGMTAASITPTPGGLGGAEVGLVAGLVGFGCSHTIALAAVLLYRLLTYWVPILPGLVLFNISLRRHYV